MTMDHGAPSGVPAVFVTRGSRVESVHAVAACVADAGGRLALALGDIETPVYLRSAAKPFIAAASGVPRWSRRVSTSVSTREMKKEATDLIEVRSRPAA